MHLAGGHGAQVTHPGGVGGEQQEEVAAAGQLVAPLVQAHRQAVERMLPEGVQEGRRGRVGAVEADAAADHVLRGESHDAPREWD